MIKSICSSVDLVGNARLGCLETDSLVAHTFLCEEIDGLLKEGNDQTSVGTIREKTKKQRFNPAKDNSLDLGNISETDAEAALAGILKGAIYLTDYLIFLFKLPLLLFLFIYFSHFFPLFC